MAADFNDPNHVTANTISWATFSSARNLGKKYHDQAFELGCFIAQQKYNLRFGGDIRGMMGSIHQGVVQTRYLQECPENEKSEITAVVFKPYYDKELKIHFDKTHVKSTLAAQQALLVEPATDLIAMPGGIGTGGEIFFNMELLRCQKSYADKKMWLINVEDYFTPLISFLGTMLKTGTISENDILRIHPVSCIDEMKERLSEPPKLIF